MRDAAIRAMALLVVIVIATALLGGIYLVMPRSEGIVTVDVEVDKPFYLPGESVTIILRVQNPHSISFSINDTSPHSGLRILSVPTYQDALNITTGGFNPGIFDYPPVGHIETGLIDQSQLTYTWTWNQTLLDHNELNDGPADSYYSAPAGYYVPFHHGFFSEDVEVRFRLSESSIFYLRSLGTGMSHHLVESNTTVSVLNTSLSLKAPLDATEATGCHISVGFYLNGTQFYSEEMDIALEGEMVRSFNTTVATKDIVDVDVYFLIRTGSGEYSVTDASYLYDMSARGS